MLDNKAVSGLKSEGMITQNSCSVKSDTQPETPECSSLGHQHMPSLASYLTAYDSAYACTQIHPNKILGMGKVDLASGTRRKPAPLTTGCQLQVTEPIVKLILDQHHGDDWSQARLQEALTDQRLAIISVKRLKTKEEKQAHLAIRNQLSPPLLSVVDLAIDDSASSWLSAWPLQEHGFALHKDALCDAIALRYGWEPTNLPSHCACGEPFDSCHALTCSKGGFTIARHNDIRDLSASLMRNVCTDAEVEPRLQPLSGEVFLQASATPPPPPPRHGTLTGRQRHEVWGRHV